MHKTLPEHVESTFHKSTYSDSAHNNCVEVAGVAEGAYVRDTQNRELGALLFDPAAFAGFARAAAAEAV